MRDLFDRPLSDLRISVTDRCNLRCRYCMPREVYGPGFEFLERAALLSFEEIVRVARAAAQLGAHKVRLTGGEPLLRRDIERLVAMLADTTGVEQIAMTTNGLLLEGKAEKLAEAGLARVTVSLDSLDDGVLRRMSGAAISSRRVLSGIDAAIAAGLQPVKVNMMVRRGVNEQCIVPMAAHFRQRPVVLRFIEYMDVGSSNGWRPEQVVPAAEIVARLNEQWPLRALPRRAHGEVATRYRYEDGAGEIGLIHSVSSPFCAGCTRARISADGQVFTCLFAHRGHDLRAVLRGGASDQELRARLQGIWSARADRYSDERGAAANAAIAASAASSAAKVEMSYIGG
ncbi:MAG TPA: GTP 3',8-cyclase MoaA [Solirubrobacteraceae bacterium]|jgi:cyclic pyranopterin phosphate synthase|nr:GTP 3',8-cyclase MoaA [Solirubrobacteraceae bacterium]